MAERSRSTRTTWRSSGTWRSSRWSRSRSSSCRSPRCHRRAAVSLAVGQGGDRRAVLHAPPVRDEDARATSPSRPWRSRTLLVFVLLPDRFAVASPDRRHEAGRRGAGQALTGLAEARSVRDGRRGGWRRAPRASGGRSRLRCPRCGRAPLFRGWFRMDVVCALCDLRFERAQGYWVGRDLRQLRGTVAHRGGRLLPAAGLHRSRRPPASWRCGCRS